MKHLIDLAARELIKREITITDLIERATDFWQYQVESRSLLFGELTNLHLSMYKNEAEVIEYSITAAVELLILSIDIFDDLEDGDNPEPPWSNTNPALTLNVATALLILSTKVLHNFIASYPGGNHHLIYEKLQESINGQHSDLLNSIDNEKDYIDMVKRKSGSLTALACLIGSVDANPDQQTIINQYGEKIGLIAQIYNDLKSVEDWDLKSDIKQKKKSLPILYMLDHDHELLKSYYSGDISYDYLHTHKNAVIQQMKTCGAFQYTHLIMELHKQQAYLLIDQLEVCEPNKMKLKAYL